MLNNEHERTDMQDIDKLFEGLDQQPALNAHCTFKEAKDLIENAEANGESAQGDLEDWAYRFGQATYQAAGGTSFGDEDDGFEDPQLMPEGPKREAHVKANMVANDLFADTSTSLETLARVAETAAPLFM